MPLPPASATTEQLQRMHEPESIRRRVAGEGGRDHISDAVLGGAAAALAYGVGITVRAAYGVA